MPCRVFQTVAKMPHFGVNQGTAALLLYVVPGTGIEPVRCRQREILSLLCLPISPPGLLYAANLASPTGFEPVAYSLEGCCSIQLS